MSNRQRFLSYVVRSLRLGGVIPLADLCKRALKAILGRNPSERTVRSYIAYLKESGKVHVYRKRDRRSFVLLVMSLGKISPCKKAKPLFNNKAKDYKKYNSCRSKEISPKKEKVLKRLAWLLVLGKRSKPKSDCNSLISDIFSGRLKQLSATHGAAEFSESIRSLHWDNCKVEFSKAHAFNYVYRSLRRGLPRELILKRYKAALVSFHGMANDQGVVFNPAGVVAEAEA